MRPVFSARDCLRGIAAMAECRRSLARSCDGLDDESRAGVRAAVFVLREAIRQAQRLAVLERVDPWTVANQMQIPDRLRGLLVEWGTDMECPDCDGRGAVIVGDQDERCDRCLGVGDALRSWAVAAGGE